MKNTSASKVAAVLVKIQPKQNNVISYSVHDGERMKEKNAFGEEKEKNLINEERKKQKGK